MNTTARIAPPDAIIDSPSLTLREARILLEHQVALTEALADEFGDNALVRGKALGLEFALTLLERVQRGDE